mgnify:CR=1 FL=1
MSFLWGVATSGHQVDGDNTKSDWWAWEQEGNIEGGVRSGKATDHWNRFREDIALAASLGINSYRFSVEWARIEPEQGKLGREAIEWYRELIAECEKHKIKPMLTLHHFTSPQWFAEQGGFTSKSSPQKFLQFTETVARELGDRVSLWCTFNEPMVLVAGAYLGKFMPPAKYAPDLASVACKNILKAHVLAYDRLHEILGKKDPSLRVGIAHNMMDFLPDRVSSLPDQLLARTLHRFYNRSWLDAIVGKKQHFGLLGLVPYAPQVKEALGRVTADYIGVNYYTKAYVRWWPKNKSAQSLPEALMSLNFARLNEPVADNGWAIHPAGFRRVLRSAAKCGLPLLVTENGIADRKDKLRPGFIDEHLRIIAEEVEAGMPIEAYYYWSLLDNFEWIKGFGPRFGLFHVDYDSFARTPTGSASSYREIIEAHGEDPPRTDFFRERQAGERP